MGVTPQYVWSGRYIDAPVLRDRDADADSETGNLGVTDSGLEERLYYTTDANMNVTALLDTGGDAVERYVYDPYGNVTIYDDDWSDTRAASAYDNAVLYCGYLYDSETGLYHVRHRSYHPALGRWMQRDPMGYADQLSLYCYVGSQPTLSTDPHGLFIDPTFGERAKAAEGMLRTANRALCDTISDIMETDEATCLCGLLGAADVLSIHPGVELADCACNLLTMAHLGCQGKRAAAMRYAVTTAIDCMSVPIGSLVSGVVFGTGGAAGGGTVGSAGGPGGTAAGGVIGGAGGTVIGTAIGDLVADLGMLAAQNMITQGTPLPKEQYRACCRLYQRMQP